VRATVPGRASLEPRRVVLIGPECTGKTRLATDLVALYRVPWSPEYAREYVEGRRRPLDYSDVDPIGRGQKAGEDSAIARATGEGARLVLLDTDLVSTMVYSRHYYGDCPAWIEAESGRRLGDLYLLHHADVRWLPDGHQREQPERRDELFERFRATLVGLGAETADVEGAWEARKARAVAAIERVLSRPPQG
jgi:nicotinamide riboside kinase